HLDEAGLVPGRREGGEVWSRRGSEAAGRAPGQIRAVATPTAGDVYQVFAVGGRGTGRWRDDGLGDRRLRRGREEAGADEKGAKDADLARRRVVLDGRLAAQVSNHRLDLGIADVVEGIRGHDQKRTAVLV